MAKQLQLRRGTTSQHSTFTGANGEVTIDTDKKVVVVHDGATAGGIPLAKQATVDNKVDKVASTDNAIVRFDGTTGKVQNSGVIIDDSNNVGIGITPSAWVDDKAIQLPQGSISSGYEYGLSSVVNAYRTAGNVWKYVSTQSAMRYNINSSGHQWYTAPSGTAGNAIAWTNAMILDASGKLVFGANTFGGRMSFTGDYAAYGETHITMKNNPTTNYGNVVFLNSSGTQVGYIQASSTSTAYTTSSDYRLKDDIKPMSGSIERVMELKPCNFIWKETGHRVDGFIAHELQEVVPEATSGIKDEMMEEEYEISPKIEATYDEEGNELTPVIEAVIGKRQVPKYQGVDQSKLVPLLTSALQEQQQIINDLKARIEILESK